MRTLKKNISKILFFTGIFFFVQHAVAQINRDSVFQKKKAVIIFTKDGKEYSGFVTQKKDNSVVVKKNPKDSAEILYANMDKAVIADENNYFRGKYIDPNIFSPFNNTFATALPIPKKTALIRTSNFSLASVHIAFAKNSTISYFTSPAGIPLAANLRRTFRLDNHLYIAPEAGIASASWIAPKIWMWSGGARATSGNSQKNFTIGAGYFDLEGVKKYAHHFKKKYEGVYINAGMQQRVSKKVSMVADVWYISNPQIISLGVFARIHKKNNSMWSFGAMGIYYKINGDKGVLPFPMVQWNTKF